MRFVWFWTFWHWSIEGFRSESLLRGPVHGIGGHWDEWFSHEASDDDRRAIGDAGRSRAAQRQFAAWLLRHWAREASWRGERPPARFVLGQIAHRAPFDRWPAFDPYRESYAARGISAIVLAEASQGEAADVRRVEALLLPADADASAQAVVSEGFEADAVDLDIVRRAATSLLAGTGLLVFLALWVAAGRRPYPRWLGIALAAGWLLVGGLIGFLLVGPEPGQRLLPISAVLGVLWAGLTLTAVGTVTILSFRAWRQGKRWRDRLGRSQVRLRMDGGLTLVGGSGGLPFCLNTLLAISRAERLPGGRSWLWNRFVRGLRAGAGTWAATGVVTPGARVEPVVLEAKLRGCLLHAEVDRILAPRQPEATARRIARLEEALGPARQSRRTARRGAELRLGFAAEKQRLHCHSCRHVAQAMMAVGDFTRTSQVAVNVLATLVSVIMIAALPSLRGILWPPAVPSVVAPSASSPYQFWVSVDTDSPERFQVALESGFWANRRAPVTAVGGASPPRAEMRLHRLSRPSAQGAEDGTIWVERRLRFLSREFEPGERVGRYSFGYVTRLGHE